MRVQRTNNDIILIISLIIFCCFSSKVWSQNVSVNNLDKDKVVATVNNKAIKHHDIVQEVNKDLRKYAKFGMNKASPELLSLLNKKALERIIDNEVLSQEIRKHEKPDIDQKARKELDSIKAKYSSQESFEQYLKSRQLTEDNLLISLKNKILMNAYLESQGILRFKSTEEEIQSFYEQRKENFKKEEQVKVRHILVQVASDADESEKIAARQKAEDILDKVKSGQDFAKLAENYSDCLRSKNAGGNLDYIERNFMPPEFDKVAFSIEKNTTSEIILSSFGYHILQVLEREPARYLAYNKARDFIQKYIEKKQVNKVRTEHVKELRQKADVKIFLD